MSDTAMIFVTVALLAVIGLLIGILLVKASEAFHVEVDQKEIDIRACLPGNNCGACGYPGCDGVAAAIAKGEAATNACPVGGAAVAEKISAIMGVVAEAPDDRKVAFVKCAGTCDKARKKAVYVGIRTCEAAAAAPGRGEKACEQGCLGYGSCVEACSFDAIHVVDGIARVDRTKCVACGKCAAACPKHLIELIPVKSKYTVQCSNTEKFPVLKTQCDVGCRGCGVCVKQCPSEAISVTGNLAKIDYTRCIGCGACAQKCPAKIITLQQMPAADV